MTPTVLFRRLPNASDLPPPGYASVGAAGLDLRAALAGRQYAAPMRLNPGKSLAVPTGFAVEIPDGYEGQVRPRSGIARQRSVTVLNAPGTIDSDYRGEIMVLLINHGEDAFLINHGDRIAQLVIAPVARVTVTMSGVLSDTVRGEAGLGSTGMR